MVEATSPKEYFTLSLSISNKLDKAFTSSSKVTF